MSEEEKEAIEYFKSDLEMTKVMGKKWGFDEEIKNNEIILNLIDKLQKEIEETAKRQMIATTNYWKDKIRNEIEELKFKQSFADDLQYDYYKNKIETLEELLGDDK